jgi:hypothetical protein
MDEASAIIARLKDVLKASSDGHLATYLGISRQNIGAARKRKEIPPGWIYKVAELTGCSMDWLRFGQGPKQRVYAPIGEAPAGGQVASPQRQYRSLEEEQSSQVPSPGEDISGFGAAVEMLAKIYASDDRVMIGTISANIRAFCEAIDRRKRERRSTQELEDLKNRLNALERKLQQTLALNDKKDELHE